MIPLSQAAKEAGVSRQYFQWAAKRGLVPGAKLVFGRWMFPNKFSRNYKPKPK